MSSFSSSTTWFHNPWIHCSKILWFKLFNAPYSYKPYEKIPVETGCCSFEHHDANKAIHFNSLPLDIPPQYSKIKIFNILSEDDWKQPFYLPKKIMFADQIWQPWNYFWPPGLSKSMGSYSFLSKSWFSSFLVYPGKTSKPIPNPHVVFIEILGPFWSISRNLAKYHSKYLWKISSHYDWAAKEFLTSFTILLITIYFYAFLQPI